jgi:hypothetical protein
MPESVVGMHRDGVDAVQGRASASSTADRPLGSRAGSKEEKKKPGAIPLIYGIPAGVILGGLPAEIVYLKFLAFPAE